MKKLLVLFFLLNLFYSGTLFAQSGNTGPLTWQLTSGILTIHGEGAMPDYRNLTEDLPPWFEYYGFITCVIIDEGVTRIGNNAFNSLVFITFVIIPATVTSIGDLAFNACGSLKTITIPSSVESIGEMALLQTHEMTSIVVDEDNQSYTSVDGVLFSKDMKTIVACPGGKAGNYAIPESVETIAKAALGYCNKLTSVIIPSSVTVISESAFEICGNLTSVSISASIKTIGKFAFTGCSQLTPVTIPVSVETIDDWAFRSCTSLTSITIPSSVKTIGEWAFSYCSNLTEFVHLSTTPITIPDNVFIGVDVESCILRVPAVSVNSYRQTDIWNEFINIEALDAEITMNNEEVYLLAGATTELAVNVSIPDILEWNSSHPSVATVSNTGKVTAISAGSTVITVSSFGKEATCKVTVIEPGKTTIEGNVTNTGNAYVRVNLYIKLPESNTKKGIIGGYVLLATTIPIDNGDYIFENLPEGSYKIEVEIDDNESELSKEIPVSGIETSFNINITVNGAGGVNFDIPTGSEDFFNSTGMIIYPNPFTDNVRITGVVETWHAASLQIQVINTAGTIVHTQKIICPDETIHLNHLPAGMYIIYLKIDDIVKTFKVIKIQ